MSYSKIDHNKDTEAIQNNLINCIQDQNKLHLEHPFRSFSMPHKKHRIEPKDHQQITPISLKYSEVASFNKQHNENHDGSLKKLRDEMQKECSVLSIEKSISENKFDNIHEVSNSNLKDMTKVKMTLISDVNTANTSVLMQNKPVNEENNCNIASENSLEDNKSPTKIVCSNQVLRAESSDKVGEKERAENLVKCRNEVNEKNNHMTKKQLQILMSRSCAEPNGSCPPENKLINDHVHVPVKTPIPELNIDAIQDGNLISGKIYKTNRVIRDNTASVITEIGVEPTSAKVEVKTPDKIRFEEIENKLEEMFAGIEDEQLVHPTNSKNNSHTSTNKIGDDFELDDTKLHAVTKGSSVINTMVIRDEILGSKVCFENELLVPINSLPPTKAAKKSAGSYSLETNNIVSEKAKFTTDIENQKFQKTVPPHRRLSIGMDPTILRISKQNDKERNTNKNKTKKYNKNRYVDKNKEITYSKSLISNNKLKQFKSNDQGATTKQKQQTLKYRRIHSISLYNDNEQEEKTQARELDNKIKSPFISVKHNGAITVVNAPTIDDLNDKNTKSKKTSTFVHERKKVRGCHSSTLSHRYDADTADTSWICVFCKQGPHKKGLGDLFGPYTVSIDCEEYQSAIDVYTHDSASLFMKRRRIVPSLLIEKTQAVHSNCTNETGIQTHMTETQDLSDDNEEQLFHEFSLGMSRISDIGFEIWLHEDCAIWAPNLFVIGSRLVGLEAAIWNSTRYKCAFCSKPGAILCCLQRDCKISAHVPCAREFNWSLDELTFWSHCKNHLSTSSSN